jgi:hypothetical protein
MIADELNTFPVFSHGNLSRNGPTLIITKGRHILENWISGGFYRILHEALE